jgi:hypothetical protein
MSDETDATGERRRGRTMKETVKITGLLNQRAAL